VTMTVFVVVAGRAVRVGAAVRGGNFVAVVQETVGA
jgi:hypothetical protein